MYGLFLITIGKYKSPRKLDFHFFLQKNRSLFLSDKNVIKIQPATLVIKLVKKQIFKDSVCEKK